MLDVKKYEDMFKDLKDEIELKNYLSLLRMAKDEGLVEDDKYNEIILKYIDYYEHKSH